jgi:hypothetical protein
MQYADKIRKDRNNIQTVDDLLVLDSLFPFQGMLYVYIGEVNEVKDQFFCIYTSSYICSTDTLFFNNKCYEIEEINWGGDQVEEAYPFIHMYFKCKDCSDDDLPKVDTRVYKLVTLETYGNLSSKKLKS